jgi:hypothetical protein
MYEISELGIYARSHLRMILKRWDMCSTVLIGPLSVFDRLGAVKQIKSTVCQGTKRNHHQEKPI